jgi:hypothetical protein
MRRKISIRASLILIYFVCYVTISSVQFPGHQPITTAAKGAQTSAFDYALQFAVEGLETFAISADLAGTGIHDGYNLALTLKGHITLGSEQTIPVDAEVRSVDDVLYFRVGEWQAMPLEVVTETLSETFGLPFDFSTTTLDALVGIEGLSVILASLVPAEIVAMTQLESGQAKVDLDLYELMQTDTFVDLVETLAMTQGTNLVALNRDELATAVRANSILFSSATFSVDWNADDRHAVFSLQIPFNPADIGKDENPAVIRLNLDLTQNTSYTQAIVAPDSSTPVSAFILSDAPPSGEQQVIFGATEENGTFTHTFEAQAGDVVTITARGIGLSFDPAVTLLSGEEILAEIDDHVTNVFALGDLDAQITDYPISEAGVYTVTIVEVSGRAGNFALTISIQNR